MWSVQYMLPSHANQLQCFAWCGITSQWCKLETAGWFLKSRLSWYNCWHLVSVISCSNTTAMIKVLSILISSSHLNLVSYLQIFGLQLFMHFLCLSCVLVSNIMIIIGLITLLMLDEEYKLHNCFHWPDSSEIASVGSISKMKIF
jgi:hypothetical protein